jgi:hypothetical protein
MVLPTYAEFDKPLIVEKRTSTLNNYNLVKAELGHVSIPYNF